MNGGPLSICLVTGALWPGGAERQLANLAVELKNRGHDVRVRVMCLDDGPCSHYAPLLRKNGIDLAALSPDTPLSTLAKYGIPPQCTAAIPLSELGFVASLAEELVRRPADVVHAYLDQPAIVAGWAGLLSGTPSIRFSWRNVNPSHFIFFQSWMPEQYALLTAHPRVSLEANTVSGARDYAVWLNLAPESIAIAPNGIGKDWMEQAPAETGAIFRRELGIPEDAPVVLAACRLDPEKCPYDMVDAFVRIIRESPQAYCIHAGVGSMEKQIGNAVEALPVEVRDHIRLLGARKDMVSLYAAADVSFLCSRVEGMPNVVMESMLMGIPVVATKAGGCHELVRDGVTGYLHDIGDTKSLAADVVKLLKDISLRRTFGEAGRTRISKYTMAAVADRALDAYRKEISVLCSHMPTLRWPLKQQTVWSYWKFFTLNNP